MTPPPDGTPPVTPDVTSTVIAREQGPYGEVVLRRRGDVLELIVDGVFAMDSADTTTEQALATLALEQLHRTSPRQPAHTQAHTQARAQARTQAHTEGRRIVVGGLGLGYTLAALLDDPGVVRVEVVELDRHLIDWARDGLVQPAGRLLADSRVRVRVADVRTAVTQLEPGAADAVLLDVDNGPGFLVHATNGEVYRRPFLCAATRALRPGGVLAVWSADPAPGLQALLVEVCGECVAVPLPVHRAGRDLTYLVYLATRRAAAPGPG